MHRDLCTQLLLNVGAIELHLPYNTALYAITVMLWILKNAGFTEEVEIAISFSWALGALS